MNIHIASRMLQYGGSFARAIADAWMCADPANRDRLETAFQSLFQSYMDAETIIEKLEGA
jgi:hypothetical protein